MMNKYSWIYACIIHILPFKKQVHCNYITDYYVIWS